MSSSAGCCGPSVLGEIGQLGGSVGLIEIVCFESDAVVLVHDREQRYFRERVPGVERAQGSAGAQGIGGHLQQGRQLLNQNIIAHRHTPRKPVNRRGSSSSNSRRSDREENGRRQEPASVRTRTWVRYWVTCRCCFTTARRSAS